VRDGRCSGARGIDSIHWSDINRAWTTRRYFQIDHPTFEANRRLLALRESLPDVAESVLTPSRALYHGSYESAW
jgi:hypothetical protein